MIEGREQIVAIPMRDYHPLTRHVLNRLVDDGEADQIVIFNNDTRTVGGIKWLASVRDGKYGDHVEVRDRSGDGIIHPMWNEAWSVALDHPGSDLTILNNDITPPEGVIGHLSRALRRGVLPERYDSLKPFKRPGVTDGWKPSDDVWAVFPDYRKDAEKHPVKVSDPPRITPTVGTMRKKGLSGFCFMIAPEMHDVAGLPFIDEKFRWYCGDGDLVQQIQYLGATCARVEGLPLGWQKRTTSHNDRNKKWVSKLGHQDLAYSRRKFTNGGSFPLWRKRWG